MAEPEPVPDFAASESAAINLVAAWQWFREAPDIITAARKASHYVRDHHVLLETLQGHLNDLQRNITAVEAQFAEAEVARAEEAEAQTAHLEALVEDRTSVTSAALRALDAELAAYRDGPIAEQRATLVAEMAILTERQAVLRGQVSDLERRAAEAQAQLDLVRSMVAGKV